MITVANRVLLGFRYIVDLSSTADTCFSGDKGPRSDPWACALRFRRLFSIIFEHVAATSGIEVVLLTGMVASAAEPGFSGDEGIGGVVVFDLP